MILLGNILFKNSIVIIVVYVRMVYCLVFSDIGICVILKSFMLSVKI